MTSDEEYREVYFGPYCETCVYKIEMRNRCHVATAWENH